jgi:hypothetical protein
MKKTNRKINKLRSILSKKEVLVFGTGYSTETFLNKTEIDNLENKITIAFQASYHNIIKKWNFIPDIFLFSDPHSSLDVFEYILNNKEKFEKLEKEIHIIFPHFLGKDSVLGSDYRFYSGTSPVWRDSGMKEKYLGYLDQVPKIKNINFLELPVYTTKQMQTKPLESRECNGVFIDPLQRFIMKKPLLGSFAYHYSDNHYTFWGQENKLTSTLFPILTFLSCKKVGVSGFDFGGPRFFSRESNRHSYDHVDLKTNRDYPVFKVVKTWTKEWYKYHNVEFYSLLEKGESGLVELL